MSYSRVTLLLKRPAADEPTESDRRCKPRLAQPTTTLSEDLDAASVLSGLFAAAPAAASSA